MGSSTTLLVSTRKGLFQFQRGKKGSWNIARNHFAGVNVTLALADPRSGKFFAALDHGHFGVKLQRSRNSGKSWEELPAPKYPPKPEDATDVDPYRKTPIPWNTRLIWSLAASNADRPGVLWCGTIPGGVFRSEDDGASWELNRALWDHPARREWVGGGADLAGVHSICVDPRDSRHVLLAVSCGGVWETTDEGKTWNNRSKGMVATYMPPEQQDNPNIQDVHILRQCAQQPDQLWAQNHNGIFRSTDGAKTWKQIKRVKPSDFGFSVAVDPNDGKRAWFVPLEADSGRFPKDGQVVVNRTQDGGKTFKTFRKGLPQDQAWDVCYRHGLDIDDSGKRLAFGSTTGNLWLSEDGGKTWDTLSHHLPPIYAVSFVKGG